MKKLIVAASLAALFGATAAQGATFEVGGHTFTYNSFEPRSVDVTVATDKATGRKMNVIRLKNGHMMALVPAEAYMGLNLSPANADMMLQ